MRNQKGTKGPNAKFKDHKKVEALRAEYWSTKITQGQMAKREGIGRQAINRMMSLKSYA